DDTETMRQERRAVRAALDRGIPFFGICLGMQVLGRVAGGEVVRCPQRETGVADPAGRAYAMRLTETGLADPLCAGLPPEIPVFQLHGEMVVPSSEVIVLAQGLWCPVQPIRAGRNAYGIQGHLEADRGMITAWAGEDPALALLDKQALMDAFGRNEESYGRYARIMITNFIAIARRGADAGKAGA
ncbi:MAG: type 1 glutamine amidotransferase, partial [Methanomicrobiales archaeon]|nr:type 1 glutamine amidotransferase [Methanomicrobiales archaeon]